MTDRNTIDHIGFVDNFGEGKVTVRINSQSACASCYAKGACTAADQDDKLITVPQGDKTVELGEQVRVVIMKKAGLKAVAIGYLFPFLLLLILLIILTAAGLSELQAGLWSLASLVPYYLVVFFMRNRIGNAFTFTLEKL